MADGDLVFERDDEGVTYSPAIIEGSPQLDEGEHNANLAQQMTDPTLDAVSEKLTETVAFDEEGQSGWEETAEEAYDLLGLGPSAESDVDYEGADDSSHTLMLTALLRFQAKALSVLLPADDMAVRTEPAMDLDQIEEQDQREAMQEKITQAERRVQAFYTDYLFHRLPSYEEDTDQILHDMGLLGLGVRKIVVDRSRQTMPVMPEYVSPGDLIVSYNSRNFRTGRLAHRMDTSTGDVIRRIETGVYRPVRLTDLDTPEPSRVTAARDKVHGMEAGHFQSSETHRLFEIYTPLYLVDDPHPQGLPRPYVVTIHGATREVLSIQRNWDPSDPDEVPLEHFVGYLYHPGRSAAMGVGLGQILMQTTMALRKAQRRMLEAGYLQNHPSGFKLSNLSIRQGDTKVRPGEFVDVDSPTGDIRSAVMMHTFEGPSPGLMQLADKMDQSGRELGGIASIDFAALMKSGVAAGPAMAAFEESTEFQTAVHRRLYKAHRKELEIVHDRMKMVMGNKPVLFGVDQVLRPGDLQMVNILPYMKPGQASRQKVIMEAQALWDLASENPDILNKRAAAENFIRALGSPEADRLIMPDPEDEEIVPMDPLSEYAALLAGQPLRAGMAQNHQAHIDAHTAQLKMLQVSSLPVDQGDAVSAALSAHIAEHMGMQLLVEAGSISGVPIEQLGPDLPPEVEMQIAPAIAAAVMQIEEMRRPPEPGGDKAQIEAVKAEAAAQREQLKGEVKLTEAQIKQAHEREMLAMKQRHERELQQMKDDAAMEREIEDNAMALRVAREKNLTQNVGASARATAGSRRGG